ncbi:hypothetical protein EV1_039921 [Malus domestica]
MSIPWGAMLRSKEPSPEKSSPEHSFGTPSGIPLVLYAKKKNEGENLQVEHRIRATPVSTKIRHDRSARRFPHQLLWEVRPHSRSQKGK